MAAFSIIKIIIFRGSFATTFAAVAKEGCVVDVGVFHILWMGSGSFPRQHHHSGPPVAMSSTKAAGGPPVARRLQSESGICH